MLKKLVKYGNSNALIFDKAILELLDIQEGSVLKIKTDGKSIILTPQVTAVSEKVNETFTHEDALLQASVKEMFKGYKDLATEEREQLQQKFFGIFKKHKELLAKLYQHPDFFKEITVISQKFDPSTPEYMQAFNELKAKLCPELLPVEQAMANFESNHKLASSNSTDSEFSQEQRKAMEKEFAAVHKKYSQVYANSSTAFDAQEYQHEAQLLAEQFSAHKNSAEFMKANAELLNKYLPKLKQAQEEIAVIAKKYTKLSKNN